MDTPVISGPNGQPIPPAAKFGIALGVGCAGLSILAAIAAFAVPALLNPFMKSWFDIDLDPSVKPPGDVRAFDPIANYAAVKAYAGSDVKLTEISAMYVRPDGTLDLKANLKPSPYVTYEFMHEVQPGPDAPPIGAGVSASGTQWQKITVTVGSPDQRVYVSRMGGSVNARYYYTNKGMLKEDGSPQGSNYETLIPDPTCLYQELWNEAKKQGAPENAVAVIDYDDEGYEFRINDTDFRMEFNPDCSIKSVKGQQLSIRGLPMQSLNSISAEEMAKLYLLTKGIGEDEGGLPPINYDSNREDNEWYVAREVKGSGVPGILSAICMKVEGDGTVTDIGTFAHATGTKPVYTLNLKTCTPKI